MAHDTSMMASVNYGLPIHGSSLTCSSDVHRGCGRLAGADRVGAGLIREQRVTVIDGTV
jgi:hypothetical protein